METRYVAHGLALRSFFALPGVVRADGGDLPELTLRRAGLAELRESWSGKAQHLWTGRLGDGRRLVVERGLDGDVRFLYADAACFWLDPRQQLLLCAPLSTELIWLRALLTKILTTVALMLGYEALHASAVDSPRGVLALVAPSGTGKTTLALELMRRGFPLIADDVLTLATRDGVVHAHPATPHLNVEDELAASGDVARSIGTVAGERWLAAKASTHSPRPLRAVCLLQRGSGLALAAQPLSPSPIVLAPYMLGLPSGPERARSRFALYATLAEDASIVSVTGPSTAGATQLADLIEESLALGEPAAGALA